MEALLILWKRIYYIPMDQLTIQLPHRKGCKIMVSKIT
jgi:hypothetical protein